jgi:hypothetical protein
MRQALLLLCACSLPSPRLAGAGAALDVDAALSQLSPSASSALLAALGEEALPAAAPAACATSLASLPSAPALREWRAGAAGGAPALFLEVGAGAAAAPAPAADAALDCTCAPAACACDKTCFCGVRATPYAGHRRAPPEGLPPLGALPPDHDCACTLGEVGGLGVADMANTIDCDCSAAPCECKRTCACTQRGAAAAGAAAAGAAAAGAAAAGAAAEAVPLPDAPP